MARFTTKAGVATRVGQGLAVLALLCLLAMLLVLVRRPLWIDEAMAMANYPLADIGAYFNPLPYYSQAAPPLFSLVSSIIAPLPPVAVRLALGLINIGLMLAALLCYRRTPWTIVVFAAAAMTLQYLFYYATEMKYYGLETAGVFGIAIWILWKPSEQPFGWRDTGILFAAALCGIASIIIAACAVGVFVALQSIERRRIDWRALPAAAGLIVLLGLYYLLVGRVTAIQFAFYADIYGTRGLSAIRGFVKAEADYLGRGGIVVVLAALAVMCWSWRDPRSRRLVALAAAAAFVCLGLAALGKFPAVSTRHVAFTGGLALALVVQAGVIVELDPRFHHRLGRVVTIGLAVLLLGVMARYIPNRLPWMARGFTANDQLIAWLEKQPAADVGLFFGGQPVIDYYRRVDPAIGHHRYFGRANPASAFPQPELFTDAFLRQDPATFSAWVEQRRHDAGAWARAQLYRRSTKSYAGPAQSLIDDAPKGTDFFIAASHMDADPYQTTSLLDKLKSNGCSYSEELVFNGGYVLRARCP